MFFFLVSAILFWIVYQRKGYDHYKKWEDVEIVTTVVASFLLLIGFVILPFYIGAASYISTINKMYGTDFNATQWMFNEYSIRLGILREMKPVVR
jgi:ATP/ADP translocase